MSRHTQVTQIAVISGKGGTGKTSVTGAFAGLAKNSVMADCDVDASDLALILQASETESGEFVGSAKASIDLSKCVQCGKCVSTCRSGAIHTTQTFHVEALDCEGCGVCKYVCPAGAITLSDVVSGMWYTSETPWGSLVHARLEPGQENSGKLVTHVRNKALEVAKSEQLDLVIIDGPPGIGCPVISTLSGVTMALIVVEPTLSAIHDMGRMLNVCSHFGVDAAICINKSDLSPGNCRLIEEVAEHLGVEVLGRIPYDSGVVSSMVSGRTVAESPESPAATAIRNVWEKLITRAMRD